VRIDEGKSLPHRQHSASAAEVMLLFQRLYDDPGSIPAVSSAVGNTASCSASVMATSVLEGHRDIFFHLPCKSKVQILSSNEHTRRQENPFRSLKTAQLRIIHNKQSNDIGA